MTERTTTAMASSTRRSRKRAHAMAPTNFPMCAVTGLVGMPGHPGCNPLTVDIRRSEPTARGARGIIWMKRAEHSPRGWSKQFRLTFPRVPNCVLVRHDRGSDSFYYDDHLLLLFNGTPLIGSFNFNNAFDFVDGLPQYDWSKIVGKTWSDFGDNATHCIEGSTDCAMPGTQQDGVVALAFNDATNSALADSVSGSR